MNVKIAEESAIEKCADEFLEECHNVVSVETAIDALKKQGYDVVFYNTDEGDEIAAFLGVTEILKRVRSVAFAGAVHIVFVDDKAHTQDKLVSLLHELGHIMLGHIGYGTANLLDKRIINMEAEAFTYKILTK